MSEPVAFEYQHEETGVIGYVDQWQIDNGFFDNNPRLQLIGPLYRHPSNTDLEEQLAELRKTARDYMKAEDTGLCVLVSREALQAALTEQGR